MNSASLIPTEDQECEVFVQWLKLNNIPHAHISNESRSGSKNAMIRGAKLKKMGQSKGYWDYDIFVPIKGINRSIDCYELIKIEMKRKKGGTISPEQKEWQKIYQLAGIPCKICKGADEAIDFVKNYSNYS
jgi:hypothetical protein